MGDFLLDTEPGQHTRLTDLLQDFQSGTGLPPRASSSFTGSWGSLAVTGGPYAGFEPLEDQDSICVVIGGPVLAFGHGPAGSPHPPGSPQQTGSQRAGTKRILERFRSGQMDWASDLDGPFVVLIIQKAEGEIICATDHLLFIPVFRGDAGRSTVVGTHVDLVAMASGRFGELDPVSLEDFLLHQRITHPHTAFRQVLQAEPGTIHRCGGVNGSGGFGQGTWTEQRYWLPDETVRFSDMHEAATYLRHGLATYLTRLTAGLGEVAHFLSGGEDSRSVCGLIPSSIERDGFLFLDGMNREWEVAKRVAETYGSSLTPVIRPPEHYLNILPRCSRLAGAGKAFYHAHAFGLLTEGLERSPAVLGGYLSDTLLKGYHAPGLWMRNPTLRRLVGGGGSGRRLSSHGARADAVWWEIAARHHRQLQRVHQVRPRSSEEWFTLWPITMRPSHTYFSTNRRLFAAREIFISNDALTVAAGVPVEWKLRRQLFRAAMAPVLERSHDIPHARGWYPTRSAWGNAAPRLVSETKRALRRVSRSGGHEGSWADWPTLRRSATWAEYRRQTLTGEMNEVFPRWVAHMASGKASTRESLAMFQTAELLKRVASY